MSHLFTILILNTILIAILILNAILAISLVLTAPLPKGQVSPVAGFENNCSITEQGVCLDDWSDEERANFLNKAKK